MSVRTRPLEKFARWLIGWAERYSDPAEREWIGAMRAELDVIDGDLAQLRWAAGVMPLLWRSYRADLLGFGVCTTVVVVANYAYPKVVSTVYFPDESHLKWFTAARPIELLFFGQQFYLPVIGILAGRATRRVLAGTVIGIAVSLVGFGLALVWGYGLSNATILPAIAGSSFYLEVLSFALVGAAFGTLGAGAILRGSREATISRS